MRADVRGSGEGGTSLSRKHGAVSSSRAWNLKDVKLVD
jgi:hypothetical protein